jgi:hypothetical protein
VPGSSYDTRRRTLTSIGDELEREGLPPKPGKRPRFRFPRPRRPQNRLGSLAYGLGVFVLAVAVLAGLAYAVSFLAGYWFQVDRKPALLIAFLVLGSVFCVIAAGSQNVLFGVTVGASVVALGFGLWGRDVPKNPDPYIDGLSRLVGPDWGRPSATCKRARGSSSGLSLCTVQGTEASDRFQVCVVWMHTLHYRPLNRCGVDAPGLTNPPIQTLGYRASTIAACLRDLPPLPGAGPVPVIEDVAVSPFRRYGQSGSEVFFRFGSGAGSLYFLPDEAGAERWLQSLRRVLPIPKGQAGKALYRRANVVVEWGDPKLDFASQLNACL